MKSEAINRKRLCKTATALFLVFIAVLMSVTSLPAYADERYGDYLIYRDNSMEDIVLYFVYTPEQQREYPPNVLRHAVGPAFNTSPEDVYTNAFSGNDIKVSFFRGVGVETQGQAEAFAGYIGSKSLAKHHCSGLFSLRYDYGSYTTTRYCVYLIEGWDETMPIDDLTHDLFFSDYEVQLWFHEVGQGNQVHEQWDYIQNTMGCCMAVWFHVQPPKDGMTVGFQFTSRDYEKLPNYF